MLLLAFTATLSALFLTIITYTGCRSPFSIDCSHIGWTVWSTWVGIPVALPAIFIYLLTFVMLILARWGTTQSMAAAAWRILLILAFFIGTTAVWFIVKMVFTGSFCAFCTISQASTLILSLLIWFLGPNRPNRIYPSQSDPIKIHRAAVIQLGFIGLLGTSVVLLGQLTVQRYGHELTVLPHEHITAPTPPPARLSPLPKTQVHADAPPLTKSPQKKTINFLKGAVKLDPLDHPIIGDPNAKEVIAFIVDYTSPQCLAVARHLEAKQSRTTPPFAIMIVYAPTESVCNKYIPDEQGHQSRNGCGYAALALAVWHSSPDQFLEFHKWLLETGQGLSPQLAEQRAIEHIQTDRLAAAIKAPWVRNRLIKDIDIFGVTIKINPQSRAPMLLVDQQLQIPTAPDRKN